jgi:sialic acid synthase SpsE
MNIPKKPYIIAEIGFNHEGDLEMAGRMIRAAAESGADAVKFQTFRADDLALPSAPHYELIKPAEMELEHMRRLKGWADEAGVDFLSTPFSVQAVEWLMEVDAPAIKVASMDCANTHLLAAIADTGRRIFLSTGMAALDEIGQSLAFLDERGSGEVVLLHCISNYPALAEELNMAAIPMLRRTFGRPVGYSDHHHDPRACLMAAVLGAEVIETHFTIEPEREDGDHGHSLGPDQLKQLVEDILTATIMLGTEQAMFDRPDRQNAAQFRRGLYAGRDLGRGERIKASDLLMCRPVSDFSPSDLPRLEGTVLKQDVARYEPIRRDDVELKDD